MEDYTEFPEESMRHIEALLSRHPPQVIQRMFAQAMDSRRNSIASSYTTSSSSSSFRSRLSVASTFSTSTGSSDMSIASSNMSIASSNSSRSRMRRQEPRSYPSGLDPTRPVPAVLTPASEISSPLETKHEPGFTPTEEDMNLESPVVFNDKGSSQSGESSYMFCTYCAEAKSLKTFKAKSDWKKHEMRMHETGEDWPCIVNGCNRIFDRQKDFLKHHQRYHSGRPLPSLTDIKISLLPRRVFGCGFDKCKEVSIGWDERCDHVAKHMKNGSTFDQWKYSNVIRNLIRQEALHDTWKELVACLDERLRESRAQISWCPDNTRILRQKLQCCDLRPSREDILITALSLRSDIQVEAIYQQLPPGFATPSKDSVPPLDKQQRMQILNGSSNVSMSRPRLAEVNTALLRASNAMPVSNFDCGESPFEDQSPAVDAAGRRISYMDLDTGEYLDVAQTAIPGLPPDIDSQSIMENGQPHSTGFVEPPKQPSNPFAAFYPNYFDAAPTFEESQYYDRPSIGTMMSKIGSRLNSRHGSPHTRPSSQMGQPEMGQEYSMPPPMQPMPMRPPQPPPHHPPPPPQPHRHQQYRLPEQQQQQHDQLHLFTSQS
ncbi:hypothetical protein BS50DRAFT_341861 [Corynespora cassiicola Philippines]|uniref:C2H2-type domain-containing protein n=1 Tax=Corynespora cassiicola Philippines TaxID=1448308 RepID=A0A2T2NWG6_CORCC|nr:hypothetical protein BS50DRAFT_341861 [Corynespora cassiicola Philippines]